MRNSSRRAVSLVVLDEEAVVAVIGVDLAVERARDACRHLPDLLGEEQAIGVDRDDESARADRLEGLGDATAVAATSWESIVRHSVT